MGMGGGGDSRFSMMGMADTQQSQRPQTAYQTGSSAFSALGNRKEKVLDTIERGKRFVRQQARQNKKDQESQRKVTKDKTSSRYIDEGQKLEEEVIEAYHERQAKLQRIGSFKFDIDNDLDVEILTSDQVFEDLDDIKNLREKQGDPDGNNSAYKSLVMSMYTRGKKKKNR